MISPIIVAVVTLLASFAKPAERPHVVASPWITTWPSDTSNTRSSEPVWTTITAADIPTLDTNPMVTVGDILMAAERRSIEKSTVTRCEVERRGYRGYEYIQGDALFVVTPEEEALMHRRVDTALCVIDSIVCAARSTDVRIPR